jgi:transcriptional regulator NrdR family protein
MQCPECDHLKTIKNGHTRGKQRHQCKACGHQFVESPQPVGAPPKGTAPPCPYCETGILHKRSARGQRLYYQCRNSKCKRFSTYEHVDGQLVHVMTRKHGRKSQPQSENRLDHEAPKMVEFHQWLDGKRRSRISCRVVGEDQTDKSLNCKAYTLKSEVICHPGQLPIRPVVYWECPEKLSALGFFTGLIEKLNYPSTGKRLDEKRKGLYEALRRSEVEMLILDEAERLSLKVLSEIRDISDLVGISVVLVGTEKLNRLLKRDEQVHYRFLAIYRMEKP